MKTIDELVQKLPPDLQGEVEDFARFLLGIAKSQDPLLELAARFTASAVQNGHVCADLSRVADFPSFFQNDDTPSISYPNVRDWIEALIKSPVVGAPGDYRPLILDGSRLYLHRYWQYEQTLASAILERARSTNIPRDPALFSSLAGRAFHSAEAMTILSAKRFIRLE